MYNNYKNYELVYHITSKKNADSILKNNFDISKTKQFAYGYGISFTTDKNHLNVYNKMNKRIYNYVVVSIINYDKLKYNPSSSEKTKLGYSKPRHFKIPKDYDGFYYNDMRVIEDINLIHPVIIYKF